MELRVDTSPFHRLIGLELVRADEGEVELRLAWREEFRREDGSDWYHGGIISALIDIAGDFAIASKLGRWVPTIDLRVDYLRPAREGALVAVARAVKVGKTVGVADVELRSGQGAVVAIGRAAYSTSSGGSRKTPPMPPSEAAAKPPLGAEHRSREVGSSRGEKPVPRRSPTTPSVSTSG